MILKINSNINKNYLKNVFNFYSNHYWLFKSLMFIKFNCDAKLKSYCPLLILFKEINVPYKFIFFSISCPNGLI